MAIELRHSQIPLYSAGGREKNQDAFKIYPPTEDMPSLFRYIVADGLGGQGGGELASWAAIKKTSEGFFNTEKLANQFEEAHQHIKKCQLEGSSELSRMATTMVVLMIMDGKAIWGHVGDSRLYLFRDGKIHFQTRDHSVPQMLVSSGEIEEKDIRHHPDRNRLLRALGDNREKIQARVHGGEILQEGDVFLLCTDGFWEYVTEGEMLASLYAAANPDEWLKLMEEQYLEPATEEEARREGKAKAENDNYTAIAVWYGETPSPPLMHPAKDTVTQEIPPYPQGFKEHAQAVWGDFKRFVASYVNTVFGKSDSGDKPDKEISSVEEKEDDPNDALMQPKAAPPKDWESKQKEARELQRLEGLTPRIHPPKNRK